MKKTLLTSIILIVGVLLWAQNQPVVVVSPNGGEIWQSGSTYPIYWTSTNTAGNVMIQLVRANADQPVMTIAHNIPAINGVWNWTIPVSTAPASDYKIKIALVSNAGTMTFDLSDGFFTINGNTDPPTNSITVLSPNGGEVWIAGAPAAITWTHQNLTGNVRISLERPNMSTDIVIAPSIPISAGSLTWVVPQLIIPANDYRVHIVWLSMLTVYIADLSDNSFSIVNDDLPPPPPPASLTLSSPNGGENWVRGTMNPITWTHSNLTGGVVLRLIAMDNTQPPIQIANNVPVGAGQFHWHIPMTIPTGDLYKVMISQPTTAGVLIQDVSDAVFAISEPGGGNLVSVISPNGGEIWQQGMPHPIRWNSTAAAVNVEISLMRGTNIAQPYLVIAPNVPNTGEFIWLIPPHIPVSNDYKIRVRLLTNSIMFDLSDGSFSIIPPDPTPDLITVTSPNGGEVWTKGATNTISWTAPDLDDPVRIILVRYQGNNNRFIVIARNAPNTGSFDWTIPMRIPQGNNYRVAVVSAANRLIRDLSDGYFSIVNPDIALSASPNPTREKTTISFTVDEPTPMEVVIYNIKGQKVRTLMENRLVRGSYNLLWDGKDRSGIPVSAGFYIARLITTGKTFSTRILIMK